MNPIFGDNAVLDMQMREAVFTLGDSATTSILLAAIDAHGAINDPDPARNRRLRDEIAGELAARLFGKYTLYEYNFVSKAKEMPSLPRFCRTLTERPACVFAYGLDTLRAQNAEAFETALAYLNNHREDITYTKTAVVIWLEIDTLRDLLWRSPDFADWTKKIRFELAESDIIPTTALGSISVIEADDLRRRAQRFQDALAVPTIEPALALEFNRRLGQVLGQLGQTDESAAASAKASQMAQQMDDKEAIRRIYLEYVIEKYGRLEAHGIPQTVRSVSLPLENVYVSLTAERSRVVSNADLLTGTRPSDALFGTLPDESIDITALDDHAAQLFFPDYFETHETTSEPVELSAAVCDSRLSVILGDPGAGKTTLLRFLAVRYARALLDRSDTVTDSEGNDYGRALTPFFLRVSQYADALHDQPDLTLIQFLPTTFGEAGVPDKAISVLLDSCLQAQSALILLDGLDEIADPSRRAAVSQRVNQFTQYLPFGNRVVVTSRIAGYREAELGPAFSPFSMHEMDDAQIERFLDRWCLACERFHRPDAAEGAALLHSAAKKNKEELLDSIKRSEGVRRLAGNPLLLTILALIHRNGGRLPERRIELYQLATQTLLRDWRLAQAGTQARVIEEAEVEEILCPLAAWMHETKSTGLVEEAELKEFVAARHAETRGMAKDDPAVKAAVDDFIVRIKEQSGLLVERSPGKYGFLHLTFEEYFAARDLVSDFSKAVERIRAVRHRPRWEEPIRLAIAGERPRNAANLIRGAIWDSEVPSSKGCEPSPYEDILRRDLLLAAKCLGDCAVIEPALARNVADVLNDICLNRNGQGRFKPLVQRVHVVLPTLARTEVGGHLQRLFLNRLNDPDPPGRTLITRFLAHEPGSASELGISTFFTTFKNWVRVAATRAIGCLGQPSDEVIAALLGTLNETDMWMRSAAAEALGKLGAPSDDVIAALLKALRDPETDVRISAAGALGALGPPSRETIAMLLVALNDSEECARSGAADALHALGLPSEQILEGLLAALRDVNDDVRQRAAEALGALGSPSDNVLAALLAAVKDPEDPARSEAVEALGALGSRSEKIVDALLATLKDRDDPARSEAVAALRALGVPSEQIVAGFAAALRKPNDNVQMPQAHGSLSEDVVAALLTALKDGERQVRSDAAGALGLLRLSTQQIVSSLLVAVKDPQGLVRGCAVEALAMLGSPSDEIVAALFAALQDADGWVRCRSIQALANLDPANEDLVAALLSALDDQDDEVRSVAAETLGVHGSATEPVLNALIRVVDGPGSHVRDSAWVALSKLVAERAVVLHPMPSTAPSTPVTRSVPR